MIDEEPQHPERLKLLTHIDFVERRVKRAQERIQAALLEERSAIDQRAKLIARLEAWDKENPPAQMALPV